MTVKGLTTPKRWLRVATILCRYEGLARDLLLDWYLGSQKLREILTLLCCITPPLRGKPTLARDVSRRISGAVAREAYAKSSQDLLSRQWAISGDVAGEAYTKVNIPSTHHNLYLSHYIICHLPLVFLSPTSPLPFYSPTLSQSPPLFPFAFCLLVC